MRPLIRTNWLHWNGVIHEMFSSFECVSWIVKVGTVKIENQRNKKTLWSIEYAERQRKKLEDESRGISRRLNGNRRFLYRLCIVKCKDLYENLAKRTWSCNLTIENLVNRYFTWGHWNYAYETYSWPHRKFLMFRQKLVYTGSSLVLWSIPIFQYSWKI